jgi:hypothetical protein
MLARDLRQKMQAINKKKIAICYHGPPRTLRETYKSHEEYVYRRVNNEQIEYKIFVHTWNIKGNEVYQRKTSKKEADHEAWRLINPIAINTDRQDKFIENVDITKYFSESLWKRKGDRDKGEWPLQLIKNYICSLESQKRVTSMIQGDFDYVMYMRPDIKFLSDLPDSENILKLKDNEIILPTKFNKKGLCDRFSIMNLKCAKTYASRINALEDYRKNNGRIVSEEYTKHFILNNSMTPVSLEGIDFSKVRP